MTLLLRAVTKHYAKAPAPALAGIDLDVAAGEFVAIRGPSGTGKTTLLQIAAGLLRPDRGRVEIGGETPWQGREAAAASFRRRHVGFLPQGAPLLDELDVESNTALPLLLDRRADARSCARARLAALGVLALAGRRPRELSGGEALRVALARALVASPRLLLADEPTSHLDPEAAAVAIDALRAARANGTTVVAVTHDPAVAAAADRQLALAGGRLA